MVRVVGTDPGTSSLDLLLLDDGRSSTRPGSPPSAPRRPRALVATLARLGADRPDRRPVGLRPAPGPRRPSPRPTSTRCRWSGPTSAARDVGVDRLPVLGPRPGRSGLPVVFLPGRHPSADDPPRTASSTRSTWAPPTRSPSRRWRSGPMPSERARPDRCDLRGRRDRLGVHGRPGRRAGRLVDASAGTRGPIGVRSGGAWDGEVAYWRSPALQGRPVPRRPATTSGRSARRLPRVADQARRGPEGRHAVRSRSTSPALGPNRPEIAALATEALDRFGTLTPLPSLPGAWVKHAAQGSALLADALAGGRFAPLAERSNCARPGGRSGMPWERVGSEAQPLGLELDPADDTCRP